MVVGNTSLYMESLNLLFDQVTFESNGDIIVSGVGINPWHALTKVLFKLSPVVACKFSFQDETLSDQEAVAVNFKDGNKDSWDYGVGQWLMTALESLNYLIKAQSGNQGAWMTELKESLRCCGCRANV